MSDQVLVTADELVGEPRDATLAFDTSVDLATARADGDYRVASGRPGWLDRRLPGSAHLDLLTALADPTRPYHFARPSTAALVDVLARLGAGARRLVVYDSGRMHWAARTWWMLRCAGIPSRVLDGGLPAWEAGGHPVEHGDPAAEEPAVDPPPIRTPFDGWADIDEVADISAGRRPGTLLCSLSPDQFAGSTPTRYARRGHIPASHNLPSGTFLTPAGTLLPPEDLARAAATGLGDTDPPIVVYCGGGISASLTALGLTLAGHQEIKVYDGSLEEWAADPALPLVRS